MSLHATASVGASSVFSRLRSAFVDDVVRISVGVTLLSAAALKAYQLTTGPLEGPGLLNNRWFLIGVVEFELVLALWLLSGLYPRHSRGVALVCFSVFASIALYKTIRGDRSCGCFGEIEISPSYAAAFDMLAVLALAVSRPGTGPSKLWLNFSVIEFMACALLFVVPSGALMSQIWAAKLGANGEILGNSQFVVVQPETWVGRQMPLLRYIDIGRQLAKGEWTALIHRHDCDKCKRVIAECIRHAKAEHAKGDATRIALVEVPPYGPTTAESPASGIVPRGRLDDTRRWFVTTPVLLRLRDGVVISCASQCSPKNS